MKRTMFVGMIFIGALVAANTAGAGVSEDLRCEALKMRREGRHYVCLSRCERLAATRAERLGEEAAEAISQECVAGCDARTNAALERIEKKSVCSPEEETTAPPDANRCVGKLYTTEANFLTCQARCTSRSQRDETFDLDGCEGRCTARNERMVERILDSAMCAGVEVPMP
jgi:hypothetical protein